MQKTSLKKYYSGIGSRRTPLPVMKLMRTISIAISSLGLILRSGGAHGADQAFESGISVDSLKEIWVPWKGFNGIDYGHLPSIESYDMAKTIHPAWDKLTRGAKSLHARNCHQVLGKDLATPSEFLICWTEGGKISGGTATAIRLAQNHNIPILNLGSYEESKMERAYEDFMLLLGY